MAKNKLKDLISPVDLIDRFMMNPNPVKNYAFNKILEKVIPFNAPHGFKVDSIRKDEINITLPYRRVNFNHVKGIHACGLATLGEYCSGLLLLYNLGKKYRLILAKLEAEYFYQGKVDVHGSAHISSQEVSEVLEALKNDAESTYKVMQTEIVDTEGNKVATVTATWQIKNWKKVKLKV
jgi:acyl-coenzyme A thioesterase PaaI-like protein